MAYFYRLIFCFFIFSNHAFGEMEYASGCTGGGWYSTKEGAATAGTACRNTLYPTPPNASCAFGYVTGLTVYGKCTFDNGTFVENYAYWSITERVKPCVAPAVLDASGSCVVPLSACPVGTPHEIEASVGWVKEGSFPYKGVAEPACVMVDSANACSLLFGGISVMAPSGPVVNGSRQWFQHAQGTLTGDTCSGGQVSPSDLPAPPCVGSVGTVNGVQVCLPEETQAEKELRAKDAANKAAKLATDIATAAGKTPAEIAAAGAAAGAAAAAAIRNGQTPTSAAAAGAAAGAGANTLGATPSSVARDAVKAAAEAEAREQATLAGKTQAQIDAAGVAARNAAGAAWDSGSTTSGAAAAGAAAGSAAANGASAGAAASAGAGAAAAEGAGDGEGEGEETESKWNSGPCAAPPICEGDAIQCAIAKISFSTDCRLERPLVSSELDAYDAAKVLTGDQTKDLPGNSSVTISSSSFDNTEFLGGGSGMSDLTVTVMGRSILLPFSSINIWLSRLGMLLQAVTFILCVRIVSRG